MKIKTKILFLSIIFLGLFGFVKTSQAERFFQQHNTWYEPIPVSPTLDADSENKVQDILCRYNATANYPTSGPMCSGNTQFYPTQSISIWRATAQTPWTRFMSWQCALDANHVSCAAPCTTDGCRTFQIEGWDYAQIPAGALPSENDDLVACFPGTCGDGFLAVTNGTYEWDCGGAVYFPENYSDTRLRGRYVCRYLRRWDLTGNGVLWPDDNKGGPVYARTPLLQGTITYNEVVNESEINHTLHFAYSGAKGEPHWNLYPSPVYTSGTVCTVPGSSCTTNNPTYPVRNSTLTSTTPLLGGERLFLPSSVNCDALGITNMLELKICKALKKYGMIFTVNSGRGYNGIFVENPTGHPYSWGSLYQGYMTKIPWQQLKVSVPLMPPFDTPDDNPPAAPSGLRVQ